MKKSMSMASTTSSGEFVDASDVLNEDGSEGGSSGGADDDAQVRQLCMNAMVDVDTQQLAELDALIDEDSAASRQAAYERLRDHVKSGRQPASLQQAPDSADVHKWYAVVLGAITDYLPVKEKIMAGHEFKEHIDRAIELRPDDCVIHHLKGRWCHSVAVLSWWERKAASALFAEPPKSTLDEALTSFLKAEQLSNGWLENLFWIAKCYNDKQDYKSSKQYLEKVINATPTNPDDEAMSGRKGVFSLNETGIARIVFMGDYERFDGTLVNADEEYFGIYGRPLAASLMDKNGLSEVAHAMDEELKPTQSAPQISGPGGAGGRFFDVTVVEAETGCQYCLKRVELLIDPLASSSSMSSSFSQLNALQAVPSLHHDANHLMGSLATDRSVSLQSEHVQFGSEEILVGNRADVEITQHITPSLAGAGLPVHLGRMNIRFQTAVTPPPTPASSVVLADECSNQGADFMMTDDAQSNNSSAAAPAAAPVAAVRRSCSHDDFMQ